MKRKASIYEVRRKSLMMTHGQTQDFWKGRWGTSQSFVSQLLSGRSRSLEREMDFATFFNVAHGYLFPPHRYEIAAVQIVEAGEPETAEDAARELVRMLGVG